MTLIQIKPSGYVVKERIIALGRADAASIKRLIAATDAAKRIDLTFGKKRKSVIVLDTGHLVITAFLIEQLQPLIEPEEDG